MHITSKNQIELFTTYMPKSAQKTLSENRAEVKKLMRKEAAQEILDAIGGIPAPGVFVDVVTNGQSNAGGFYEVIRDTWGKVDEICLATWIINREYIDMLFADLNSGKLGNLVFIISNRMSQLGKGHSPNFNRLKTLAQENPKVKFRVANSHAKVFCLTNGSDFITVSGSGNWSDNPRIENYSISNDRTRFDFHKSWMEEIADAK